MGSSALRPLVSVRRPRQMSPVGSFQRTSHVARPVVQGVGQGLLERSNVGSQPVSRQLAASGSRPGRRRTMRLGPLAYSPLPGHGQQQAARARRCMRPAVARLPTLYASPLRPAPSGAGRPDHVADVGQVAQRRRSPVSRTGGGLARSMAAICRAKLATANSGDCRGPM